METRLAQKDDLTTILEIYNQGIQDRIATLESEPKDRVFIQSWFEGRSMRHPVFVALEEGQVIGWASINPYNNRCAYQGVGDISIYVHRKRRGQGIGSFLLAHLHNEAKSLGFHKLVLFTFPFNSIGQRLYLKMGYRIVGIFKNQGILDGRFVDVQAMEILLNEPMQ